MIDLEAIPKPYTCQFSRRYAGIDILFDNTEILTIPLTPNKIHRNVVLALNGAFLKGYLLRERELK